MEAQSTTLDPTKTVPVEDRIMDVTTRFLESMNHTMVHQTFATRVMVEYNGHRSIAALEYERGWRTTRQNTIKTMREDLERQLRLPEGKKFRFSRRLRNEKAEPVDFELLEISPDTVKNEDMIVVNDIEEPVEENVATPPVVASDQSNAEESVPALEPDTDNTDAI